MKDNIKPEGSHYDILLINDDLATIRLLTRYFESEGVTCKSVISGTRGLEELANNPPKVVLLNIILPDYNGFDIIKKIKSNEKLKNTLVFFFTTIHASVVEKYLAETKADGYIHKPFKFSDFDGILDLLRSNSFKVDHANFAAKKVGLVPPPKPHEIIERYSPKERYYPTAEKQINQYITLKLENGRTHIYVNGIRFIQCIRLILNIQKEDIPIYDEIESIDEAVKVYKNYIYHYRIVQGPEAIPVRDQNYDVTPEQEFWGHCSNIQAWVENDYDTRILISNISFPLLKELARAGDPIAKRVFKEEIVLRLESGYPSVVQYILTQGYIKVCTPSEIKSILEATDIIKNLSSSPCELNRFLRSCFHWFPTLIEDILLQILKLQDGKNIIFSIIQKDRIFNNSKILINLESLLSKVEENKIRQDILDCIKKFSSLNDKRLGSAKISLFGDSYSGKEELVQKFTSKMFDEDIKMDIGADFYVKDLEIEGKKVVIRICALGGEQRFKMLLRGYTKGSNGAIIIYDVANSMTLIHLDEWIAIIRGNAGDIPIMLVGNILNLEAPRSVSKEEAIEVVIKYNLAMYLEISTSTGENVETMFEEITGLVMAR